MKTVSDYDPRVLGLSRIVVRWIWKRMYTRLDIDLKGLEAIRPLLARNAVILAPCHKSHMDYLLLSLVFYENDLVPPHTAAGINLSFFPMGTIFRKTGAFFLRRSILGEALYARLLSAYVRWLIRKGFLQEYFIEGGRTRTGKLVVPKTGLLALAAEAFLEGAADDVWVLPVAITYDRVPEDESYRGELEGRAKKREDFWTVWRSRKLLGRSHGAAYLRFAHPISMKSHFSGVEDSVKLRKARTTGLARAAIRAIAAETVVTTTALLATVLLREGSLSLAELGKRLRFLREQFRRAGAPLAPETEEIEATLPSVLGFFAANGWIRRPDGEEGRVELVAEERLLLDFYKNTTLHHLLPAIVASSEGDVPFEISSHEFTLEEGETAAGFRTKGNARIAGISGEERGFLSGLIGNYVDTYRLASAAAADFGLRFPVAGEKLERVLALGRDLLRRGELRHPEALSLANLKSAFARLHAKGTLQNRVG